jgi:adenylylsulfate kinase
MNAGTVAWITGLPSAGKTTFAERAFAALRARGAATCLLDGDAVRSCLVPKVGFSAADRDHFYATLANLAALMADEGLVVLVAATAHRREFRERARARAPAFVEVWVDTPLEECALRDAKGLYAAARTGVAHDVPGANEAYEPPDHAEVVAHGGLDDDAVERLVAHLLRRPMASTQKSRDPTRD